MVVEFSHSSVVYIIVWWFSLSWCLPTYTIYTIIPVHYIFIVYLWALWLGWGSCTGPLPCPLALSFLSCFGGCSILASTCPLPASVRRLWAAPSIYSPSFTGPAGASISIGLAPITFTGSACIVPLYPVAISVGGRSISAFYTPGVSPFSGTASVSSRGFLYVWPGSLPQPFASGSVYGGLLAALFTALVPTALGGSVQSTVLSSIACLRGSWHSRVPSVVYADGTFISV